MAIPLNDNDDVSHRRVKNGAGQRSDDSRVVNVSKVVSGITDAGHEAARNRSGDQRLSSRVGSDLDLTAAVDGHGKTELVGIDLFTGKRSLVTESVLVTLKDSSLMQDLWKSYQRKFPYAADYSWNDVMWSARKLAYEAGLSVEKPSVIERIHKPPINGNSPDSPVRNSKRKDDLER